jgi:mannan endo-1,4-beta-mannosidase
MAKRVVLLAAFALLASAAISFITQLENKSGPHKHKRGFVATRGTQFVVDGQPFRFIGANVAVMYKDEDRARMPETLSQAARAGVRVVRVWASGEGNKQGIQSVGADASDWPRTHPFRFSPDEWNEDEFVHLDRVLAVAAHENLRVQLCLANWWRDTGGVTQYLQWAGIANAADKDAPYGINVARAMEFYTDTETRRLYREHVARIVSRRNSITGVLYRDDPTIMSYELMNEAQSLTERFNERRQWIAEMSAYIKALDPNHLVTPGTWGYRTAFERREWLKDHALPSIDYCDVHLYPRDDTDAYVDSRAALREFIDNRVVAARFLYKPLIIGEFGMTPEGYQGLSQLQWYEAYFESTARDSLGGAMFWILTPDPSRGYGITYTNARDQSLLFAIKRAAAEFSSPKSVELPSQLLYSGRHLIPRQFAFNRSADDAATRPLMSVPVAGSKTILYRFRPEAAARARFEKLGGGVGYIWGTGAGFFEYVVPARSGLRSVSAIFVRAHLQPVLPHDAIDSICATRVTLFVNDTNCGSRLVRVEASPHALTQEWRVDSSLIRAQAALGRPLKIRFAVEVKADQPFGLNVSGYPEGYDARDAALLEVEVR